MNVHSVSLKGMRRQNEDKHNIILNIDGKDSAMKNVNFFSIFDGHGGKEVSAFLHDVLYKYFVDKRISYPMKREQVNEIFNHLQKILETKYSSFSDHTGSTCLLSVHYKKDNNDYLNIANLGDCRMVLCRDNIGIPLTKDHKPMWPEEKYRIEKMGGKIYYDDDWRVKELSVSRAFGDVAAKPYVTHIPDFYRYKLDRNDKFFVMACDGLWDVLSNQDAVNFVLHHCYELETGRRINKNINISKKIGEYAISKGSGDNITAIVVFLK